jgi:hypothetical protein
MGKMHRTLQTVFSKIDQARQISISEQNIAKNQVHKIRNSSEIVKISGSNREYILYSSSVSMRRPLTTCSSALCPLSWERCAHTISADIETRKRQEKCRPKASGRRCERGHRISLAVPGGSGNRTQANEDEQEQERLRGLISCALNRAAS